MVVFLLVLVVSALVFGTFVAVGTLLASRIDDGGERVGGLEGSDPPPA